MGQIKKPNELNSQLLLFKSLHPELIQLMVNCWFGAFSGLEFESGYTVQGCGKPFHFRGFQESKSPTGPKPTALTIS